MEAWQRYLDEHRTAFLDQLIDLLRIPSIAALPEHAGDVQRAAEWVAERLRQSGMEAVQVLPTTGHPAVYGEWLHAPGRPTVLLYGHFDVQPVDPLELWVTPPFEPTVRDGRVFARGASDMKGGLVMMIQAVEALLATEGALPVNLKFLIESEEEIASPSLAGLLERYRERFACDLVVTPDSGYYDETRGAVVLGLKGVTGLQIDVTGARSDLHSGVFGGVVQNPLHVLVHILDSMRGEDGRILVDGFYDGVPPLSEAERALIAAVPYDEEAERVALGVSAFFGEAGYSPRERGGARPTLEINGLWGGFQGEGVKTVLPNAAHAKITCRLVAGQEPDRIHELIVEHIRQHTLPGVEVSISRLKGAAKAYLMPADHPGVLAAKEVLTEVFGNEPYLVMSGGTLPLCPMVLDQLGAYTLFMGFQGHDEGQHAPNESFRISSLERGRRAYCLLLHKLALVAW